MSCRQTGAAACWHEPCRSSEPSKGSPGCVSCGGMLWYFDGVDGKVGITCRTDGCAGNVAKGATGDE